MPDLVVQLDIAARLLVATLLGGVVGMERERLDRPAGLRTYMLVSLGSALFGVISVFGFASPNEPSRVAAQVVTGIGFLGAATVFRTGNTVLGLTTAAGIWTVAAIGLAAGVGLYVPAVVVTLLSVFVLYYVKKVERSLDKQKGKPTEVAD
jgi:putative Mg2+ transporter-C (MgtC) family protein